MSSMATLVREAGLVARERSVTFWALALFVLSVFAVASGIAAVRAQTASIERLLASQEITYADALADQSDWGSAAYYGFHLTYAPPQPAAFMAMGQRDQQPWKHRIRMLALEGQIHERDAANPELALVGRFDWALLVAFILPLALIAVLHDLHARERAAGRYELLVATAGNDRSLWLTRAAVRTALMVLAVLIPLWGGGAVSGTSLQTLGGASLVALAYAGFWTLVCLRVARWQRPAPVLLSTALGIWLALAVVLPATARAVIDALVPLPAGAEILLTQREAVNDAWDLPKSATMDAFVARHPEWAEHADTKQSFEWKWYYAFQQVGDQVTEPLSEAWRIGRMRRDQLAGMTAWCAPPTLVERALQSLAGTDLPAMVAYEESVRAFHAELRAFYYRKMFLDEPFSQSAARDVPVFSPPNDDS